MRYTCLSLIAILALLNPTVSASSLELSTESSSGSLNEDDMPAVAASNLEKFILAHGGRIVQVVSTPPVIPEPEGIPITFNKFVEFDRLDPELFSRDDLLIFGVKNIIVNRGEGTQPRLGDFFKSIHARGIPCFMLRYNSEDYTGKIDELLTQQGVILCDDLASTTNLSIFKGSIYGRNYNRIHLDLKYIKDILAQDLYEEGELVKAGHPTRRIVYFEEDYELLGRLESTKLDFPLTVYYKMTPKSVSHLSYLKYTLLGEDHLQWILEQDIEAIARRIRQDPLMLARPVYKPFAEAKGVELIEALDSRSKHEAIHKAFKEVGEEDHLLTRTIDLVLMPSNRDYCRLDTNEQMVNIARVYDPYIWPSFFYVLSNFFIDPATDPDEPVAVFSTLVRTYRSDPNFLSQICRLPPPEVRIGVTTRVADKLAPTLAKLSPALSECLRSRDFEMTFPYLGSAGKFADTLVKEPARTQEVAAAFLRAICRLNQPEYIVDDLAAADDPDLISFERRWNEVSAYTCMPVVKMIEEQIFTSDPEVWERVYASLENIEGYFAEIIIDNSFLKQLFKRRADFLGIKYLCGTPPEHLSIIQDYIWALQRDGFISESSDDHIIQAIISIFRSCKKGFDLHFTRNIIGAP